MDDGGNAIAGCFAGIIPLIMAVVFYVYYGYCFMIIAQKTGTPDEWWAWVPILNILLMLNIAKKPTWWIVLFLIPIVNVVIGIIAMMGVAEARGKPSWLGILLIVPIANLVLPGYLAFVD